MTIPASLYAQVNPEVLAAGGAGLVLNGVLLTYNPRTPIGAVVPFPSVSAVAAYYGAGSIEASLAATYFLGYNNKSQVPGNLYIAQYPWTAPVNAYARGGSVSGLSLAALQALSGNISITINGTTDSASSVSLSAATSFSSAAEIIQTALAITGPAGGSATASSITGTVMTVGTLTGTVATGDEVTGAGVASGTYVGALLTGSGGSGSTYTVTVSQTVASETLTFTQPAVYYDSISGGFVIQSATTGTGSTITAATGTLATSLLLTAATGVTLSQGAAIATPAAAMAAIWAVTQNWVSFMTAFEPVLADKEAFALWTTQQNNRVQYVCHDTDANAIVANNTTCFGYLAGPLGNNYSGVVPISGNAAAATAAGTTLLALNQTIAAFVMGACASINFGQTNGDSSLAYKSQNGITPNVEDLTSAVNLRANNYNYYGGVATANQGFEFFYPGSITGPFLSIRRYVDQIWLNSEFQLDLMELQTQVPKTPYTPPGYAQIKAALSDTIQQALTFGMIEPGTVLSSLQVAEINNYFGAVVAPAIQSTGYYLQVLNPGAQARVTGASPIINFAYTDGGEVLMMNLGSIDVQ